MDCTTATSAIAPLPRRALRPPSPAVGKKRALEQPATASKYGTRSKIQLEDVEFAPTLAPLEMITMLDEADENESVRAALGNI